MRWYVREEACSGQRSAAPSRGSRPPLFPLRSRKAGAPAVGDLDDAPQGLGHPVAQEAELYGGGAVVGQQVGGVGEQVGGHLKLEALDGVGSQGFSTPSPPLWCGFSWTRQRCIAQSEGRGSWWSRSGTWSA